MTENTESYKQELLDRGFAIFPTHGIKQIFTMGKIVNTCTCGNIACPNPGKHPATMNGLKSATKDMRVLENLYAGRALNVAVATGIVSGCFVVDIDGPVGEESLAKEKKLPKTLTSITGRGRHLFFKYPHKKVFNRTNVFKSVDVRGDGGYCVAPYSMHISGIKYQWEDFNTPIADAPEWLLDVVCSDLKAPKINESALNFADKNTEWTSDDIAEMLEYVSSDMGFSDWINIGMAIHSGGFSFQLWDNWSKRSSKYDSSTAYHWRSFKPDGGITIGTLVQAAQINGWKPNNYIIEKLDYDSHPARDWLISIGAYVPIGGNKEDTEEKTSSDAHVLGFDPLKLPVGIIGDTVRWICDTSIKPQPVLALLNVLCALGAVFGRRYASPIDTRTNLYICGIAGTARGKDQSRKAIKNIMAAVGLETFLASDDIKSATGMLTTLNKKPSCIMMIDEFGLVLHSISNDKSGGHKQDISSMLLKLYTHSNSVYTAGDYADKKMETTVLKDPNLCIYGTTTLDTYLLALKRISIASGNLNRFIVLPGDNDPEIVEKDFSRGIPEGIIESWKSIIPVASGLSGLNSTLINHDIKEVSWGEQKDYIYKLLHIEKQKIMEGDKKSIGDLWGRFREHIIKIAMIFAISRNMNNPKLELEDIKYAEIIVSDSINYVAALALDHMYENEFEQNKKHIYRMIRDARKKGVTKTEILRKNQKLKSKEVGDIVLSLTEEEVIEVIREPTGGQPRIIYRAV